MSHKAKDHKCKYTQVRNKNIETYLHLNILEIRPHRRCWGVIVRMALVKGYRFTWGGVAGKNTYYVARRVFRTNLPYVAQKLKNPTHY